MYILIVGWCFAVPGGWELDTWRPGPHMCFYVALLWVSTLGSLCIFDGLAPCGGEEVPVPPRGLEPGLRHVWLCVSAAQLSILWLLPPEVVG